VLQTALKQNNFSKISISDKINENKVDGNDWKRKKLHRKGGKMLRE